MYIYFNLFLYNVYLCVAYLLIFWVAYACKDLPLGSVEMLVRFPWCHIATRGDYNPVLEKLSLGAFEHGLSVHNTHLFCFVARSGLCLEKSNTAVSRLCLCFPFHPVRSCRREEGQCCWQPHCVREADWGKAATVTPTSDQTFSRVTVAPRLPPARVNLILDIHNCSSDVLGMRQLGSPGLLIGIHIRKMKSSQRTI